MGKKSRSGKDQVKEAVEQLSVQLDDSQDKKWLCDNLSLLYLVAGQVVGHECCCDDCGEGMKKVLERMLTIKFVSKEEEN